MRSIRWIAPTTPDKCLHVETPLGIVNIRIGLRDADGRRVDSIEVIPNQYVGEPEVTLNGLSNTRLIEEHHTYEPPALED